jgi:hypothetical protein
MRTTLTLDEDVIVKIRKKMKKGGGQTFKEAVNETLRHGLLFEEQTRSKGQKPFKVMAKDLGLFPNVNYDKTSDLLAALEIEEFREQANKL